MELEPSHDMESFWSIGGIQYLTVPRSVIQAMSKEWQDSLAFLLNQLDEAFDWRPSGDLSYWVSLASEEEIIENGEFGVSDILSEYKHGNSYIDKLRIGNDTKGFLIPIEIPDSLKRKLDHTNIIKLEDRIIELNKITTNTFPENHMLQEYLYIIHLWRNHLNNISRNKTGKKGNMSLKSSQKIKKV